MIDLDAPRREASPDATRSPLPVRRWRTTTAAALAGVLVLAAGGAAPAPPPPLREVHATPLGPVNAYRIDGDLLVTATPVVDPGRLRQRGERITGYDLARGRRLWSTDIDTDEPTVGLVSAGGVLLVYTHTGGVQAVTRTMALDLRTGERRWSVLGWVNPVSNEPVGLVSESVFAPESRLAPDQDRARDETYYSADGTAYGAPPIGLVTHAVDLDTGRTRWTSPLVENALAVPSAGDQPAVFLTVSDGQVEVRDLATATVSHRLDWPGGELGSADRVADVVVVSRTGPDPRMIGYSADLRQQRWNKPLISPEAFVAACGPVVCQSDSASTVVFDPATGESRWRLPERVQLLTRGSRLVEVDPAQWLRRVIDPRTGRAVDASGWQLADTSGWNGVVEHIEEQRMPVLKPVFVTERTGVGLLDLAGPSIRPLGVLPYVLRECVVARPFMACRTAEEQLRVWRYESAPANRG